LFSNLRGQPAIAAAIKISISSKQRIKKEGRKKKKHFLTFCSLKENKIKTQTNAKFLAKAKFN
jgi:hypothetical protein